MQVIADSVPFKPNMSTIATTIKADRNSLPDYSDFLIEGKTFEIGGKKKGQKQISQAEDGYVVKDDIETGFGNVIPLWAFGMNY